MNSGRLTCAIALGALLVAGAPVRGQTAADQPAALAEPQRQAIPRIGPTGAPVLTEVARAERQMRAGDAGGALATVERFLADNPQDVPGRFLRGVLLSDLKRTDAAIAAFTELTLQHPHLPEPYNNLAVLYAGAGQLERARVALEHAASANPRSATVQENLGDLYVRLAREAYQRASDAEPARGSLRTKLAAIRALAPSPLSPSPNGVKQ